MKAPLGQTRRSPHKACGRYFEVVSPLTGDPIDRVRLTSKEEIVRILNDLTREQIDLSASEVFAFLERLKDRIQLQKGRFLEKIYLETGFIVRDGEEVLSSALEFLNDFKTYVKEEPFSNRIVRHSYSVRSDRDMRITSRPYRCIAGIVPQNASLTLSIIIIASALYSGSKVILRPSLQCSPTGALLAQTVMDSDPPESCVRIVNSLADDFLEACYASPEVDLIHYIGSNRYVLPVFHRSFLSGKICVVDGQGNGLLYLDRNYPLDQAVSTITSGAIRFNGQTCTSVNGVLIHEGVYRAVKDALAASFKALRVGDPLDPAVQVGPLFSERQAERLRKLLKRNSGSRILCGAETKGAYFYPAVLENVGLKDSLVREGFSGPAIWIRSIGENAMWAWVRSNRFPLSDTILSHDMDLIRTFARRSKAARICVNQDPTVESMFEPWGGYPPSGMNPVSLWVQKYRQVFQLDGALKQIVNLSSDVRHWEL
jgi:acyl-CoA reductase-like NAD-dependent aldehyde dehydrogenase